MTTSATSPFSDYLTLTRTTGGPMAHHRGHQERRPSSDDVLIDGQVSYWTPDGEPCSLNEWGRHYDASEVLIGEHGSYRVVTLFHGLNAGRPTPPRPAADDQPIVWVTIDAWRKLHFSSCRVEALVLHELALADARHR